MGPPLARASIKLHPAALRAMVATPQKIRPGTAMPSYWDRNAVAGASAATRDRVAGSRGAQLEAVLARIRQLSSAACLPNDDPVLPKDPTPGEQLFDSLNCQACHPPLDAGRPGENYGVARQGPDLRGAGDRLRPAWLMAWLRGPHRIWPRAQMPDFRLSHREAADLAAYLLKNKHPHRAPVTPLPHTPAAKQGGKVLLEELGCQGCHPIMAGGETITTGPDLTSFGDKPLERLAWGSSSAPHAERTVARWTRLKLTTPLALEEPGGALKMPWQHLRGGELPALELVLRGMSARPAPPGLAASGTPRDMALRQGEALVRDLGCRECHRPREPWASISNFRQRSTNIPPLFKGLGAKLQPGWLMAFLQEPFVLRPWSKMRMPRFDLDAQQAATLAGYMAAQERVSFPAPEAAPPPLSGARLAGARALFGKLQCLRCHDLSNAGQLKPGELAPDLALGAARLRRSWIRRFILTPQVMMPGTRMPELFPLADEDDPGSRITPAPDLMGGSVDTQLDALTDLSIWWGQVATRR